MQLSKLEIKGFKSFGDKVVINFDKGITGIVGPNGCGKSNIVDAIRWVLGEQKTKALRSDKMENVIFNGTKKRKATQLAEVSLTFNNTKNLLPTEYSQVMITRRYYRSGDSEYELNGVTCRLKDITNLFLDTGIASNSYAIIELKMVDDLLNDKDNSRRGLFEEAAGISKFKKRKKETMRKLEGTDADLERVEDLLFEIEKNLKSLERQAKQAERYYKLKESYKKYSVAHAKSTIGEQTTKFQNLTSQIEVENDKKVNISKLVAEQEAELEKLKTELLNKEKLLGSRQKSLNEHVNNIRQYESEKKIKNERLRFLTDKSDNLKEQIELDKKSNERAAFSIQSLTQEKLSAVRQLEESTERLKRLEEEKLMQQSKTISIKDEAESLTQLFRTKEEEVFQLKKRLEINQIQISSLKQQLEKSSADTSEQSANLIEFEKRLTILNVELKEKKNKLEELIATNNKTKQRIISTEKTIEVIREERTQIGRKLDARQNEYNLTKSLVDSLEGFPEAIKFLKKQPNWDKSAPLLSDIITCNEEYRVAIENYLEPLLNYYVIETEAEAYKAINLLSDAAKGKAHFFILDSFKNFKPTPTKIFANAFHTSEIIEFDGRYKNLISHILDDVYMVDGDEKNIPPNESTIFITKSGKITKRNFSLSGGSVGLFEGKKIGRAKNLEKLDKEIKTLSKQQVKISDSLIEKQTELEELKSIIQKNIIDDLTVETNQLNEEYITIYTKQEQFSHMISQADVSREDIIEQIDKMAIQSDELKPKIEEELKALAQYEVKSADAKTALQENTELHTEKSAAFNEQNIFFHQQEGRVKSLEQEIGFKQSAFDNSAERIEKNQIDFQSTEQEIKTLLDTTESNDDNLIKMYGEKESIEEGVNEAEKAFYSTRGQIDQTEKEQRNFQHNRENIDSLLLELHNSLNEAKLELSSVKERLSVEFNVDLDQLMIEPEDDDVELSGNELIAEIEKTKSRIDSIGPINPMAMEAYDEIKERHTFITTQKEDLLNAKESLMTTISEIDLVAKTTFSDAFDKIKVNFIKVFRSLFTDQDDCDLILTDPNNPLDSGIDIIAKPKGKKPLTINQLSGGEKTLTATSLLFAIYLLKPAPFCIFDEVDAPLDDANIDKFNTIIKDFSKDSQFIIVTHNKRTMASTDIIYGITMIEQGVSRVIPVDLRELA